MIPVIYFYFRLPANVKFFLDLIFTVEKDFLRRLVSSAGVIGGRHATFTSLLTPHQKKPYFEKTRWERITSVLAGIITLTLGFFLFILVIGNWLLVIGIGYWLLVIPNS